MRRESSLLTWYPGRNEELCGTSGVGRVESGVVESLLIE